MLFNHQLSLLTQILFKKTTIVFDNDLELIIKLVNGTSEQAFDYEFSTGNWIFGKNSCYLPKLLCFAPDYGMLS